MTSKLPLTALAITPKVIADSRRALWLSGHKTLIIADLHIGYAWSHRSKGQLLPVSKTEDTVARLTALLRDYEAEQVVLLGDIVHDAVSLPEVKSVLDDLLQIASRGISLTLVLGNHDRRLIKAIGTPPANITTCKTVHYGEFLLTHGDDKAALAELKPEQTVIMGHEHPTVTLEDGVASAARCPCFLVSQKFVVMPAFSTWANGCTIGRQPFLSPLLKTTSFGEAIAIVGSRLLRLPLKATR